MNTHVCICRHNKRWSTSGVIVKVLDCNPEVCEFKLQ